MSKTAFLQPVAPSSLNIGYCLCCPGSRPLLNTKQAGEKAPARIPSQSKADKPDRKTSLPSRTMQRQLEAEYRTGSCSCVSCGNRPVLHIHDAFGNGEPKPCVMIRLDRTITAIERIENLL